jgi:transketolase
MTELDEKCINTIRFLSADAIEKAKSGHPGMPMGAAAAAYTLWARHLRHNPYNPGWVDRDRFVLSSGHASMLLYALLHLAGYDISLEDLKSFRQWGSKTPGHPERNHPPGTEVTTGPLGQGVSNAVGMAVAEAHLAARFNRPGYNIVDHFTYVMAGDGDLMEGVAYESCSLAGHLGLGKLIVLYDDNRVTLAGSTALSFTENVGERFAACGWHVQRVENGNSVDEIDAAIRSAQRETERPSLICVQTTIGYGAPCKQGSCETHGSPLGPSELAGAKQNLNWPSEPSFFVPDEVHAFFQEVRKKHQSRETSWKELFNRYDIEFQELASEFNRIMKGELPSGWDNSLPGFTEGSSIATRKASETVMQSLAAAVPELMGGSADLNPSTFTWLKGHGDFEKPELSHDAVEGKVGSEWGYGGRNIHFGVREHAMGAVSVGMALHGGIIPYTATFLVFADYMRPPMRLAALMGLQVVFIFTHDSIGVGEDGPTHQPVEHLMSLRAIPNLTVIRPADAGETVESWQAALLKRKGPTALIFSRQNLPVLNRRELGPATGLRRGGYILWEAEPGRPDVILIGTGSELNIALEAGRKLASEGIKARVVSLPSWELFDSQPLSYRQEVLPSEVKARVAVEAAVKTGWEHYVGLDGVVVGMDSFGASAPAGVLYEKFGITAEHVAAAAKNLLARKKTAK